MSFEVRILLVSEDVLRRRQIHALLHEAGCDVTDAESSHDALAMVRIKSFDVVLVGESHGGEAPRGRYLRLRAEFQRMPILVLSASNDWSRAAEALDAGIDAYAAIPRTARELSARIRTILRRPPATETGPEGVFSIGDITLDTERRLVLKSGHAVHLTSREYSLLEYLMAHPGIALTHSALLTAVWGPERARETAYLRKYINLLRKKLDPSQPPRYLLTDSWIGYRFADPADPCGKR
jgi:two-component system KDP operon response regulator KdpE